MKILFSVPYLYNGEWDEFKRNSTGFGMMVYDIFNNVSKTEDAYLISNVITKGHGKVLKHTWFDVIRSVRFRDIKKAFKDFFAFKQGVKMRARLFYYALNSGYIRRVIKNLQPDAVHVHGVGYNTKSYIDACNELRVKYIVTMHGLIGLSKSVSAAKYDKEYEKEFTLFADKNNIPITVIGTKIKERIEDIYLQHKSDNVTVVCNGTDFSGEQSQSRELLNSYGVGPGEKIIVSVGSVYKNKNQVQIVRALATGKITSPCHLLLCGKDCTNGEISSLIENLSLADKVHLTGFIPREKLKDILTYADVNVVSSIEEGFGLSVVEAYSYGIPSVMFADLDAVPDLYDERAMIKVGERTDESLASAIEQALQKDWDREYIKEFAKEFSLSNCAKKYINAYKKLLNKAISED